MLSGKRRDPLYKLSQEIFHHICEKMLKKFKKIMMKNLNESILKNQNDVN